MLRFSSERRTTAPWLLQQSDWRIAMPEKATVKRSRKAKRAGRAPTT